MTSTETEQALALSRCKFSPGSTAKRFLAWVASNATNHPGFVITPQATAFLDRLAHQYRKQIGRCMSVACTACLAPTDRDELAVALDAVVEGRTIHSAEQLSAWRKAALARYNTTHGTTFAHPYAYSTRVAANNRRANTLGDVYCRFCGEGLFSQVKQPHKLVASSTEAQQHLTICALHILTGMREPVKPGYRAVPMEAWW